MHIIFQVIIGVLIGELGSSLAHWIEDSYLPYCTDTPLLRKVAKENEMHHYYPRAVIRTPWYKSIYETVAIASSILLIAFLINRKGFMRMKWLWLVAATWAVLSCLTHKYSHYRDCELCIPYRILQDIGLLSNHQHHAVHHNTSNCRYAPSFPALNVVLDWLTVFRMLECIVEGLTGVEPDRKMGYNDYKKTEIHTMTEGSFCPRVITGQELDILESNLAVLYQCPTGMV